MSTEVLHVDDEPPFLEIAERSYARLDDSIRLTAAASAAEATDHLDGRSFDCVVSDYVTVPTTASTSSVSNDGTVFVRDLTAGSPRGQKMLACW